MTRFLTLADLSELLQVSKDTARAVTLQDGFPDPLVLSGKTLRWAEDEVEEFLLARRAGDGAARRARLRHRAPTGTRPRPAPADLSTSRTRTARERPVAQQQPPVARVPTVTSVGRSGRGRRGR